MWFQGVSVEFGENLREHSEGFQDSPVNSRSVQGVYGSFNKGLLPECKIRRSERIFLGCFKALQNVSKDFRVFQRI